MKRLFFTLLSIFIINLKVYGNGEEEKIPNVLYNNTITENTVNNKCIIINQNTISEKYDCNNDTPKIMIGSTIKFTSNKYQIDISNIQDEMIMQIKDNKLLINYTCVDGYTNQYYATANDTYLTDNKITYDKGCFNYVRYCSDSNPNNCFNAENVEGYYSDEGFKSTLPENFTLPLMIKMKGSAYILLVQDTSLTDNNLKWCESNIYTETDTTTDPHTTVIEQSKCGTGGGSTTGKFACKKEYESDTTPPVELGKLCKAKPINYCCFNNTNQKDDKDNYIINEGYLCNSDSHPLKTKNNFTPTTTILNLTNNQFNPCSSIVIETTDNCHNITNDNISTYPNKTCYGGPKDNFYLDNKNTIVSCPVIASTTNHNYDNINGSNSPDWNNTGKGKYNFGASSCKFYGKNSSKNNKTGFCDQNGNNCLYFDNDYEIEQITICNDGEECYSNNTEGKKFYKSLNKTCEKNQKISKGEKSCK